MLFSPEDLLSSKPDSEFPVALSKTIQKRGINHMSKFKPFHQFQKPLVGLSPEAFLDYIEGVIPKDHLCRLVKEVVFSLDTGSIEVKYSFRGKTATIPN